jgi:hypothetical protein
MYQIEVPTQTGRDLLVASGVAAVTALLVQLLVRPLLKLHWGVSSASEIDDPKQNALYSLAMNLSSLAIALILAFIAQALFADSGLVYETAFEGFLVAVFGAVGAIALGEVVPNFVRCFRNGR